MKPSIVLTLMILGGAFSPIYAQLNEVIGKEERTAKSIAEAAEHSTKVSANKQVNEKFKLVQELHKERAQYLKDYRDGKVRPFADHVAKWPEYEEVVKGLNEEYTEFLKIQGTEEGAEAGEKILGALQVFGFFLKNGDHKGYTPNNKSVAQLSEENELMNKFNELPSSDDGSKFALLTPDNFYTIRHIPIPISFSAPPNTEIILHSEVGGNFSNKLDYISLTTNEHGIATTSWVSHGDGVATCKVTYRSPAFTHKGHITPIVKSLELIPVERISPVLEKVAHKALEQQK